MPLPPLPPNSTPRVFVQYTTGRIAHELTYRYDPQLAPEDTLTFLSAFLTAVQPVLCQGWALIGAEYQEAGSIIRLPFSLGSLAGLEGNETLPLDLAREPGQFVWVGRGSQTGRRVRLGLFGIAATPPATYRFTGAARPSWAVDATDELAATSTVPITVGGDDALWYEYVNFNYNSYWETEARQ